MMTMSIYSTAVRRSGIDYILISAESEEQAIERVQQLLDEGDVYIQLGSDGYEVEEIQSAFLETSPSNADLENVQANDEAFKEITGRKL